MSDVMILVEKITLNSFVFNKRIAWHSKKMSRISIKKIAIIVIFIKGSWEKEEKEDFRKETKKYE